MLAERLTAQLLSGPPAADPVGVARRLLAVQAQDLKGARLAVRARTLDHTAEDVDRALSEDRSLVVSWLNRGTLHLVAREDYPWLQVLTAPRWLSTVHRRLDQEGVTPVAAERGFAVIERALAEEGPLTREALRERLDVAGVRTQGQALIHHLSLACLRGTAVRGPMAGARQAYVLVRDWLGAGALEPVDRPRALAELARRYLAGHGPAGDRDLARWAGLPLRDARAGLKAIASDLVERDDGLVHLAGRPAPADLPPPRLLGAFEPVLLGWTSRAAILGPHESAVVSGGIFRPFALVRGRAVGPWSVADGSVRLDAREALEAADAETLDRDAADVARFLGLTTGPGGAR